ncbi:hypothetical protein NDU88_002618 [Pleurodeles waltl]|uniref:Uncharacterized protein n=1 Tax=Pleurodeles waltl TaxID=8319 RepID=A0AAV7SDS3_PLEWA|nr:hypothetical protein NDU88_002618 [Pleurodeles waltl]
MQPLLSPFFSFVPLCLAALHGWAVPGAQPRHLRAAAPPHALWERTAQQGRAGPAGPVSTLRQRPPGDGEEVGGATKRGEAALMCGPHSSELPLRRSPPASYLCPSVTEALRSMSSAVRASEALPRRGHTHASVQSPFHVDQEVILSEFIPGSSTPKLKALS